jgi:hypothetical protein
MNITVTTVGTIIIAIIVTIFSLSIMTTLLLKAKYSRTKKALLDKNSREKGEFDAKIINNILQSFKAANKSKNEVNTLAIIDHNINSYWHTALFGERFIKNSISLMIILGLMGTFFGLTMSVDKLMAVMSGNLDDIVSNLTTSVQGMAVAFNTSLFGIGASVLLTIFKIIFSIEHEREGVYIAIEDYLDNHVAKEIVAEKLDKYERLVYSMEKVFREFGTQITLSFEDSVKASTQEMMNSQESMKLLTDKLEISMDRFSNSLGTFSENTRDLSEFNHHLRSNVERMSLKFEDLTDEVSSTKKDLKHIKSS